MTVRIGVFGASGRVGKVVIKELANFAEQATLCGQFSSVNKPEELQKLCKNCEVIIDFSTPDATCLLMEQAKKFNCSLVIGTTGFTEEQFALLEVTAKQIPILYSPNMSLGINLLKTLAEQAAHLLDESFDVEILEMHHRDKKDAPSGTSLMLGKAIANAKSLDFKSHAVFDRLSLSPRQKGEISFAVLRGGNTNAEHQLIFAGNDETIILTHRVNSRTPFATGAIKAAIWLKDQPADRLYSISDIILPISPTGSTGIASTSAK